MKRNLAVAISLLIAWACYGYVAYWAWLLQVEECVRSTFWAECLAIPQQMIMLIAAAFALATGALAFLAFRRRSEF